MRSRFRHWRLQDLEPAYADLGCGGPRASEGWAEEAAERARRFGRHRFDHRRFEEDELVASAGLGVRRPLRFLAWKLDLDDGQTTRLARILERLKLERAQAALDLRRAAAELADALESDEFARAKVESANEFRASAAKRVEAAVALALEELHQLLQPEQRARLAELVRTGLVRL